MAFAATAKRRELVGAVGISEGELGTSAGESTGKAAAWACPCRRCRLRRSHGRRSDWGPLGQFGTAQSGAGKRPLDQDSDVSDTGLPDAKIPKTGAGPGSDDAPDNVFNDDNPAVSHFCHSSGKINKKLIKWLQI
jgi:hypothetical protein